VRWASLILCLFMAFGFAGASAPLLASDLKSPRQSYPDGAEQKAEELDEFCHSQRRICRKICNLRFREDLVGCPQSCDSREVRCGQTGCFRWAEPEYLIAERFGGYKCVE
jgi:hypothetical protein